MGRRARKRDAAATAVLLLGLLAGLAAACGEDNGEPGPGTNGTPTGNGGETPDVTEPSGPTTPGTLPDLVPRGIGISVEDPSDCRQISNLGSFIAVDNIGDADAGPFTVEAGGQAFAFDGAAAGETVRKWFSKSDWGFEPVTITVRTTEAEADTSNNTTTQVIPVPTPIPSCTPTPAAETPTPS